MHYFKTVCASVVLVTAMLSACDERTATNSIEPPRSDGKGKGSQTLADCETFDNLMHCKIGNATLTLGPTLMVKSFGSMGTDGVEVSYTDGNLWQGMWTAYKHGSGNYLNWSALADGDVIAELRMMQSASTDSFDVVATFTGAPGGSKYRVDVLDNGTPQGGQDSIPGNGPPSRYYVTPSGELIFKWFRTGPNAGACEWTLINPTPHPVKLPNGQTYTGDEVRFTEQIASGQYPYWVFEGVRLNGKLDSLAFIDEKIEQN